MRVYFVGVSTEGSRIHDLFPRWMRALGMDARIEGVDLPLGTSRARYRAVVERIAAERDTAGAVITAHKLGIYDAASDLFGETDRFASLCREVSAIAKRGDRLTAHARDPLAAGATLRTMLGPDYWVRNEADVLCLGAGGAATAIALTLLTGAADTPPGPRRILFVDVDTDRLHALRRVVDACDARTEVDYLCHLTPQENDGIVRGLPPASLIINATGMGKDRPGSPLTDAVRFPQRAVAWDLNYRGALTFLAQARAQSDLGRLAVHDGWLYFLHGWSEALSPILDTDLTHVVFR